MEISKKIVVRSRQTKSIMDIKLKNGASFIETAMTQLGMIYRLAAKEFLYPYLSLIKIYGEVFKARETMQRLISDFERLLVSHKVDFKNVESGTQTIYKMRIGNPVVGEIVYLLELYDWLNFLLRLTHNLNLFNKNQHQYFLAVSKNTNRVMAIFKMCLALSRQNKTMQQVSITQYLENDPVYLQYQEQMGDANPSLLYSALNIESLPRFPAQRRNIILEKLKKM